MSAPDKPVFGAGNYGPEQARDAVERGDPSPAAEFVAMSAPDKLTRDLAPAVTRGCQCGHAGLHHRGHCRIPGCHCEAFVEAHGHRSYGISFPGRSKKPLSAPSTRDASDH